ncbi:MAG: hypothetical protein GY751_24800, partial [Bacteroidetes bacterium]|nr:hypothetical protein [Bacteroidota bacterium]
MRGKFIKKSLALALIILIFGALSVNASKVTKLLPNDGDDIGDSVSVSGDYAIVSNKGSAYIFHQDGTAWTQQAKFTASEDNWFGSSVSISGDYAIVGNSDYGEVGNSVYIYHRDGNTWTQQAKFTANDGTSNRFGTNVSISGDYAIVGDHGLGHDSAYIFHRNGNTWTQQAEIRTSDSVQDLPPGIYINYKGRSVSISGDYAIMGADQIGNNAAYIFHRNGNTWTQQAKLRAGAAGIWFGESVSISGDYAIVGDYGENSAYIYHRDGTTWTKQATCKVIEPMDYYGWSVSISDDCAIIGSMDYDPSYVFYRNGTSWTQQVRLPFSIDHMNSAAISGNYAIVGGSDNFYDGEELQRRDLAYIYDMRVAQIYSPLPGSKLLLTNTTTFTWNDSGADRYRLWIGTSEGDHDIYSGDQLTNTSCTVSNTLWDGKTTIYVRLFSMVNGKWLANDCIYTTVNMIAEMQSPKPNSELLSTSVTFTWNDSGADHYWLWVGTSLFSNDIYRGNPTIDTSVTISDLPREEILYVRLWSQVHGKWFYKIYEYTVEGICSGGRICRNLREGDPSYPKWIRCCDDESMTKSDWTRSDGAVITYSGSCSSHNIECPYTADMQSPTPGSILNSTSVTFTWNNSGASLYRLWVGTSEGGHNIYSGDHGTDTSATISDLPGTLYVRLWSMADGNWFYNDYTYTAIEDICSGGRICRNLREGDPSYPNW